MTINHYSPQSALYSITNGAGLKGTTKAALAVTMDLLYGRQRFRVQHG
jgi:hypothetical protein